MSDTTAAEEIAALRTDVRHIQAAVDAQVKRAEERHERLIAQIHGGNMATQTSVSELGAALRGEMNTIKADAEARDAELRLKLKSVELSPGAQKWSGLSSAGIAAVIAGAVAFIFSKFGVAP